ncbi:hypothetical protein CTI12_AA215700 [Artemisia annua]|uniref:DUF4283 domain-containing protein n=1 Tax=Artemisia annua TaxID=35608 RepID=A0A2U1NYA4_ARTAN|nr:hypothetical protein CTI12_AA215700 [Artemisia annua]
MPPESKPPDRILEEFCSLTGMESKYLKHKPIFPSDVSHPPKSRGRPKGVKNRSKSVMIKVQSPGSASAGAGAILKRLRNSKKEGLGRSRSDAGPFEGKSGKRSNTSSNPIDEALVKVLDRLAYDKSISEQMVFKEGVKDNVLAHSNVPKSSDYCSIEGNDGSFIRNPIEPIVTNLNGNGCDLADKDGENSKVDPVLASNKTSKPNIADVENVGDESLRKTKQVGMEVDGENSTFIFGDMQRNKGILNKPTIGLNQVHFGPSLFYKPKSAWSSKSDGAINIESFAEKMKKGVEDRELQMKFDPQCVTKQSDGSKRIAISVEDIKKGSEACALQLYGYFVGTSMDYRVVNANLSKMWRVYGISDITKTNAGLFYFKFKNEEGMKAVLESGPWMINNVPLVLNVWEPGIWLEKVEPSTIPIWVCVYGIPMELCNGNGIGKIMSGVGRPMLMDRLTKERCLKKSGKLDFARVLVEVSASEVLPTSLEIEYPVIGNRPARVGKLDVKYQWKPPQCTFCSTFGHSTVSCKLRPRTDDENAANVLKAALNVNNSVLAKEGDVKNNDDGFLIVGKKNKIVSNSVGVHNDNQSNLAKRNVSNSGYVNGFQNYNRSNGGKGPYQQNRNSVGMGFKQQNQVQKGKSVGNAVKVGQKVNVDEKSKKGSVPMSKKSGNIQVGKSGMVHKPPLSSKYDANFQPKVLVRGSNSTKPNGSVDENLPISNSFDALKDQDMMDKEDCFNHGADEEYQKVVWPKLQAEVVEVMVSGIYPSLAVRSNWSLAQLDFFYNNCPKYGMEPYVDDEVESETDGMAVEMKPDCDDSSVPVVVNDGTNKTSSNNES